MDSIVWLQIVGANANCIQSLVSIADQHCWRHQVYESGEAFLTRYRPAGIESLIVDLDLPGMHGLQLIREIRRRYWSAPIIATHAWPATRDVVEAMQLGASDFLEQPFEPDVVRAKVTGILEGNEGLKQRLRDRSAKLSTLSAREREVLDLLLAAATTMSIANRLQISPKTVEKHRTNVMTKLNVNSVPELMKLWLQCVPGNIIPAPTAPPVPLSFPVTSSPVAHS